MKLATKHVEAFLIQVEEEVGNHRLREFCANFAAHPVDLDHPEEQSSEMQDLFATMLEYCEAARLRAVLQELAENGEHYVSFLIDRDE
ncbi:hypothetical protein BH10PLA2_BH10PLA2_40170 [soil metagenome]